MENVKLLEQLASSYMLKNQYQFHSLNPFYVGNTLKFRVCFWSTGELYREFQGTVDSLIQELQELQK